MIPRTFPSTYASNGQQQMVVYFLPSITGLQRWLDYIPVKLAQGGVENSYNNNGYIDVTVVSRPTAAQQAWKEYIPVYLDDAATDAWRVNARGYIPYGYALFGGASMIMDMTNTGALDSRVTFSRTSNATQFDSAGNLVYAPHNLLSFSDMFANAAWTKVFATVSANTTAAPDGSTSADKLIADATSNQHRTDISVAGIGGLTYTFSVYAKAGEYSFVSLRTGNGTYAAFDLSNGTASVASASVTATITPVGNGWYRCSASETLTASGTMTSRINVTNALSINNTQSTFTGDGTSGIFIWGAQLNVGSLQPYNNTTVKNMLGFTQEFDNNTAWPKTAASVTANAAVAPDGSTTADKLIDTAASTYHFVSQTTVTPTAGVPYVGSVYVKDAELGFATVQVVLGGANAIVGIDLSNGTITTPSGGTASVTSVGNGWYRVAVFVTTSSGVAGGLYVYTASSLTNNPTYLGTGTNGIFVWGAQLSPSGSLDAYTYNPVAAPAAAAYYGPRFDYDPATLAARGLLIEEQRTNSIRNSVGVGAVAGSPGTAPTNWNGFTTASAGITPSIVAVGTEAGIPYIDWRVQGTFTGATGAWAAVAFEASTTIPATVGTTWTQSAFFSLVAGSLSSGSFNLRTAERDATGAPIISADGPNIIPVIGPLAQQRASFTRTLTSATVAFVLPQVRILLVNGATYDFTLRIGLPQLEQGAFATSVIPTTTAAATRTADVASMVGANFSNWYRQDEGTLFAEATPIAAPNASASGALVAASDGTNNNRVQLAFGTASSGNANLLITAGGVIQANPLVGSLGTNATRKVAGAYQLNSFQVGVGGLLGTEDISGTVPVVSQFNIGAPGNPNTFLNGHLRRIAYYPRRLANSELQAISQ